MYPIVVLYTYMHTIWQKRQTSGHLTEANKNTPRERWNPHGSNRAGSLELPERQGDSLHESFLSSMAHISEHWTLRKALISFQVFPHDDTPISPFLILLLASSPLLFFFFYPPHFCNNDNRDSRIAAQCFHSWPAHTRFPPLPPSPCLSSWHTIFHY